MASVSESSDYQLSAVNRWGGGGVVRGEEGGGVPKYALVIEMLTKYKRRILYKVVLMYFKTINNR